MFDSFVTSLIYATVICSVGYVMDVAWWRTKVQVHKSIVMFLMLLVFFNIDRLYDLFFISSMPKLVGIFIIYWAADYFIHIVDILFSKGKEIRCCLGLYPVCMVVVTYFL